MAEKYYEKTDKKAFFYPQDMFKIMEAASEKQLYNIRLMLETGARINEIRNIDRKDLDTDRNTITLRITKVRAKLGEKIPNPRTIPISADLAKFIRLNINKYKIYSTNNYRVMIKKLAKQVGVNNWKDFSSHNMRKTFGTWMLALGIDGFKLAQHLGHSPEMLRTHYASPDIFNIEDKLVMNQLLHDIPGRLKT